jgi:hypothetical protein
VCRLDKEIQAAARRGSELNARELVELPTLVAAVNDCLRAFEERCRRALETSTRQEAEYESLTLAVDDVVRVVQFHDITRQQVEHVVQALRQLCPVSPGITVSVSADAGTVLSLQSSQLGAAAGLFASSIDRTGANLASMAGRVENMAEASQALMGSSEQEQDSFFLKMEGHFTAIL